MAGGVPCVYTAQRQQTACKKECLMRQLRKYQAKHRLPEKQRKAQISSSKLWTYPSHLFCPGKTKNA
ncbi:hypothetical protein NDU88_002417 [Pleurodeles waltl]|uniref:Uncharacterized protein n=1 Tax=Pleurodeles waltl TaxID=8319 RepID=A0AAV7M433_PLEWA|nr:hypothetical protein NDU88_002417 [Pleurodeles waltl]